MIPEIILKVKSLLELELISVMEDISELESILQEEERKNEFLLNKVEELEAKNKELSDKLKSKTSNTKDLTTLSSYCEFVFIKNNDGSLILFQKLIVILSVSKILNKCFETYSK